MMATTRLGKKKANVSDYSTMLWRENVCHDVKRKQALKTLK